MKAICTLSLAFLSSAAQASFMDADTLLMHMQSLDKADNAIATWYIGGVHDALNGTVFCSPRGLTTDQLYLVVQRFLHDNLALISRSGAEALTAKALSDKFPCPNR